MARTTKLGLKLIDEFESNKLVGYLCPAREPTISRGVTTGALRAAGLTITYVGGQALDEVIVGKRITNQESDRLFAAVIDHFENAVERLIGNVKLTKHQFDALVSLAFNIGLGAFAKSTLLRKIKAGELDAVPAQFMRWNKVNGRAVEGLTRRRRAEAALWRGLDDEAEAAGKKLEPVPMPQKVDEPQPSKGMATSTIGNGAAAGGVIGSVGPAIEVAHTAKDAVDSGKDLWETVASVGPWLLLIAAVIGVGAFIWLARRRKLIMDDT